MKVWSDVDHNPNPGYALSRITGLAYNVEVWNLLKFCAR